MKGDVGYFEINPVFNGEPVELLVETTRTAGLRRTGNETWLTLTYKLDLRISQDQILTYSKVKLQVKHEMFETRCRFFRRLGRTVSG